MAAIDLRFDLWPRQKEAFESIATEILFGGASEGGKSHFVRIVLCALCIYCKQLQCVLIRKKFDDILKNHVEGPTGFRALLKPLVDRKLVKITESGISFWNGSNIAFQHCQDERQFASAQGVEKHVLVIDEATQISAKLIEFFRAWVRMPFEFKAAIPEKFRNKLPLIIYTANPIGASVGWFRRNFIKARKPFEIEEINGFLRQYIPSRVSDNPSVDAKAHAGRLAGLADKAIAEALDKGDWDTPLGDFFRDYDDTIHAVEDFIPPAHWFKFRTFDWGSAEPFSVLWWAVSDGEEFIFNGQKRWFPRGALIAYREWHGCDPEDAAKGLWMRNPDIAAGIVQRTTETTSGITLTDSLPFQDRGDEKNGKKYKIADTFAEHGVPLTRANTARVYGCAQIRDRLIGGDGGPMLYFTMSCVHVREYLPSISHDPTNPETCVDKGEASHSVDTVRYACATKPYVKDATKPIDEKQDPRQITPKQILSILKKQKVANGR